MEKKQDIKAHWTLPSDREARKRMSSFAFHLWKDGKNQAPTEFRKQAQYHRKKCKYNRGKRLDMIFEAASKRIASTCSPEEAIEKLKRKREADKYKGYRRHKANMKKFKDN